MSKVSPGVVTGEAYNAVVNAAKEGGYALPAVNVVGTDSVNAVLEAAAKAKSDVIIQLSNGGAQFFAGKGYPDAFKAKVLGAVSCAQHVHLLAKEYGVCVALHTDHANKKLIPWVEALVEHSEKHFEKTGAPLFSSHMLDLSEETLEENLSLCEKMLRRMAPINMSLEIELGVTGGEEDGVGHEIEEGADSSHLYTQPDDVLQAYNLLNPKLRPEILKNSQALVQEKHSTANNPLHLVFHGGSGSNPEKITEAVGYGVFKMNIDTDTQFAFANAAGKYVLENEVAFKHQLDPDSGKPYKKVYDPRKWLREGELGLVKRLEQAFDDLGSTGRSAAQ